MGWEYHDGHEDGKHIIRLICSKCKAHKAWFVYPHATLSWDALGTGYHICSNTFNGKTRIEALTKVICRGKRRLYFSQQQLELFK